MHFQNYDENKNLIDRLDNIIENDIVSHAYIFEGPGYVDKKSFADSFITVSYTHLDVYKRQGKTRERLSRR